MNLNKFYRELVRRNVFRAVLAYLAVAWVLIEFTSVVLPAFDAPPYLLQGLIYLLAIGLFFWAGFAWVYDLSSEGWKKTPDWEDNTETREANTRRLNAVIAVAGITAILLLLAGSFWAGSQWSHPDSATIEKRIAVLPLESESSEEPDEYFTYGITEALISELSSMDELAVLSLASTRFLEAGIVPSRDLYLTVSKDIDYFVFGSYLKSDYGLDVTINISQKIDGAPEWNRSYREDISNANAMWRKIAKDVSEVFGYGEDKTNRLLEKTLRPVRPETYELYLKGKYHLNKSNLEDWERAMVYFQEAIDRNPADAYAYAGLAEGYITLGHNALTPPDDVFPKALAASKRAIQLDSANAEGWAALSHYHTYFGWDWELADYAFNRANVLNPNMAYNHFHRSWYLALFGRMEEAIEEHKRAKEIDPFSALHTVWLGGLYNMTGDYEKALEEADLASQMDNDYALSNVIRGRAYIGLGQKDKALEAYKEAARVNFGWKYLFYGPALFELGHREEGLVILKELEAMPEAPFFSLGLANMYFRDGNLDKTFFWLEKAKKHAWYPWTVRIFLASPEMMEDPRYSALLEELNLPPLEVPGSVMGI